MEYSPFNYNLVIKDMINVNIILSLSGPNHYHYIIIQDIFIYFSHTYVNYSLKLVFETILLLGGI